MNKKTPKKISVREKQIMKKKHTRIKSKMSDQNVPMWIKDQNTYFSQS